MRCEVNIKNASIASLLTVATVLDATTAARLVHPSFIAPGTTSNSISLNRYKRQSQNLHNVLPYTIMTRNELSALIDSDECNYIEVDTSQIPLHRQRTKNRRRRSSGNILPLRLKKQKKKIIRKWPQRHRNYRITPLSSVNLMKEENKKKEDNNETPLSTPATDVSTLRAMFGTNKNKLWGDLDNETSRRLYHALLPSDMITALCKQGLKPEEVAPIAFKARCAAKKYVRERNIIPGRILAVSYDGFRHLMKHGFWSSAGNSWEQIWSKYENEVKEEVRDLLGEDVDLKDIDLTSKICQRIIERSCITNKNFDNMLLDEKENDRSEKENDGTKDLLEIARQHRQNVNEILKENESKFLSAQEFFVLRLVVFTKKNILMLEEPRQKAGMI